MQVWVILLSQYKCIWTHKTSFGQKSSCTLKASELCTLKASELGVSELCVSGWRNLAPNGGALSAVRAQCKRSATIGRVAVLETHTL